MKHHANPKIGVPLAAKRQPRHMPETLHAQELFWQFVRAAHGGFLMKPWALLLALSLLVGTLTGCGETPPSAPSLPPPSSAAPQETTPPEPPPPPTHQERAAELLATLPVEAKVGQLIFARCPETGAAELVQSGKVGGILLFGRDFKGKTADEVIQTSYALQKAAAIPLLIGVDEEGGTVVRASANPGLRSTKFQSPQAVFAAGGLEGLQADTEQKDVFLKALGVNVNLAPVADVSTDAADFIYDRTFGQSAFDTGNFVETVVRQMNADGMGSVLKHFPGYGNNVDTHTGISLDTRPLEQLRAQDALPFIEGWTAGEGSTAVLVSHNVIQAIDETLPASLSPGVHAYLRELGFEGVSMTDDLVMDAVQAYTTDGTAAVLAVVAGNDLLITSDPMGDIAKLLAAVEAGTISQQRLDEAVTRVLVWKMTLGLL